MVVVLSIGKIDSDWVVDLNDALLVSGLKGALFLEALPRDEWPSQIFYYKLLGEDEAAHTRLLDVLGGEATEVEPRNFQTPKNFDLIFAVGWQYLVHDFVNLVVLHDSLLPRYRGFAPTVSALIKGETSLGVTALKASGEVDSGQILSQCSIEITYPLRVLQAFELLAPCYVRCFKEVTQNLKKSNLIGLNQESSRATYSIWRDESDLQINWKQSAEEIIRFVHACGFPYIGAQSFLNSKKIIVYDAEENRDIRFELLSTGKVWRVLADNCAEITCGSGVVKIFARWSDSNNPIVFRNLRSRLS